MCVFFGAERHEIYKWKKKCDIKKVSKCKSCKNRRKHAEIKTREATKKATAFEKKIAKILCLYISLAGS